MKKYAMIADVETNVVSVGTGTDYAFYKSVGMVEMDVEQGYDGTWYIAGYAPKQPISEVRTAALSRIDSATSAAILAGFEYEVEGELLHFSYDSFDQQNFADTANGAILAMQGVEGLPQTVTWNGWRNHTAENKGDLVRLVLDVSSFLNLYTDGALTHKATHMEICGQRKDAIYSSETVEEINNLLKAWQL